MYKNATILYDSFKFVRSTDLIMYIFLHIFKYMQVITSQVVTCVLGIGLTCVLGIGLTCALGIENTCAE